MRSFERSAKDFAGLSGKSQTSRRTLERKSTDSVNWNMRRLDRAKPELRQTQKNDKGVLEPKGAAAAPSMAFASRSSEGARLLHEIIGELEANLANQQQGTRRGSG
jgi:hypothetical protein